MNKKYLSLVLSILLIGILVLSSSIAFASNDCTGPKVNPVTADYKNNQPPNDPLGAPDPRPSELTEGTIFKALKIDRSDEDLITGLYQVNDLYTYSTDINSKFEVYITNNGNTFAWESNMPVYHVWVKGGKDGGYLYSYQDGEYSDCGLKQPPNNDNNDGNGWSHITFYYLEEVQYTYETAWAQGDEAIDFKVIGGLSANNWGWTNGPLTDSAEEYVFDLYASKDILVGSVTVVYTNGKVTVDYELIDGYILSESHVWVGKGLLPTDRRGRYTNAPGQLYIESETFEGPIYVAFHAVVGIPVVD